MPLHLFRCANHHVTEHLVPLDHAKWQQCPECEMMACQIPSAPHFKISGVIPVNDSNDDPWEGTRLEGAGEPNVLTYKSDKIQVDLGKKTQVGGKAKPVGWAQRIAEA